MHSSIFGLYYHLYNKTPCHRISNNCQCCQQRLIKYLQLEALRTLLSSLHNVLLKYIIWSVLFHSYLNLLFLLNEKREYHLKRNLFQRHVCWIEYPQYDLTLPIANSLVFQTVSHHQCRPPSRQRTSHNGN